jgi:hypothetical protein
MRNFSLADLREGLVDLFENRGEALKMTQTGKLYGPILAAKRKAIENADEAARRAQTGDVGETDAQHDGLGAALWNYTESVLSHPFVSQGLRESAKRIREAFIPDLGVLSDSYADEAAAARQNRPKLVALEADLKRFPTPDGTTLHTWATAFVDQGDAIARQLAARSQTSSVDLFRQHTALRVTTIGLVGRFRAALRDELAEHPQLPRDMDTRIFAYFDELGRRRAEAQEKRSEAT